MNKIRKPGEHPGKGRIPGIRPISTKETRNKKRWEFLMSDTANFISKKLQKIEENYSASTNLFQILNTIKKVVTEQATNSVEQVNNTEDLEEKIRILHNCILTILSFVEQSEQNMQLGTLRYQHEVALLNSMTKELDALVKQPGDEKELQVQEVEELSTNEEENDTTEETEEEAAE